MKKRLLSFLLCLAILAGQIPAAAFAAEDTPPTEPAAAETLLNEQNATESPAPAAEEEPETPEAPETQQPAATGEAAPEQTPDQQPTQQPETEGSKGTEAAPTPEEQPVPPENNVEDQGEAQPEQQPAEGAGPADANSEETEEQPGDSVVTYTITFTDELGTASDETGSEITQAAEGTLVTITAKDRAEEGLLFTAWQAPEGLELADDTEEITTFTMPDSNVELAAEYAPLPEDAEALAEEEEIMLADASGAMTGSGTKSNPYCVSTYAEMKDLLQTPASYYIKVVGMDNDSANDGVPIRRLTAGRDFQSTSAAIKIPYGAHHHLEIATDVWFVADRKDGDKNIFSRLIDVESGSSLEITGTGSLRVEVNALTVKNAIIDNWGGELTIDGSVTLNGIQDFRYNVATRPIWIDGGVTNIKGGYIYGHNNMTVTIKQPTSAISFGSNLANGTELNISGGTIKQVNNRPNQGNENSCVLYVKNDNDKAANAIHLTGGIFEGGMNIETDKPLSELLAAGYQFYDMDANTVFDGSVSKTQKKLIVTPTGVDNPTVIDNVSLTVKSPNERKTLSDLACSYSPNNKMVLDNFVVFKGLNNQSDMIEDQNTPYDANQEYTVMYVFKANEGFSFSPDSFLPDVKKNVSVSGGDFWKADTFGGLTNTLRVFVNFPSCEIDEVSLNIKSLDESKTLSDLECGYDPSSSMTLTDFFVCKGLKNTSDEIEAKDTPYDPNQDYTVVYVFKANEGFSFASNIEKNVSVTGGDFWKADTFGGRTDILRVFVNFPGNTPIDSVTLNVPELKVGDTPGDFTLSGTNTGVSAVTTEWKDIPATGVVESTSYSAFVRLKAENGYVFDANTNVTLIGDYWGSNTGISSDGKTMTVLVGVRILHKHTFGEWKDFGNSEYHIRECSCLAQEKEPHEWKYLEGQDKYKCTVCGHEIDGEKERIGYVYASPRSPIAGEHPGDYTPAEWVKIGGTNYKVESIVWKNMDDTDVTTFEAGKIYKGTVTFKANTGFAFDGDRIYGNKIFNSSNAEIVGNYSLADGGTTLTATFKLKDNTVVRPGLQVKVKLPTLNDKIGQSFPAAELVDTTLPDDVELTTSVYEDIFGESITGPVEPNKTYIYGVMLQLKGGSDVTKAYNVSYTVTDGGDAEYHTDNLAGYGILARYQTPDTSKINGVALTVTAPKYGEAPATTATGANDTLYTVGTPTWSPAVTDGKFGAAAYTVSIPVTAKSGYTFDANCLYTVNGYVATYADGKVSYEFPALTAPHEHSYGTDWKYDDTNHWHECECGDKADIAAHSASEWKPDTADDTKHYKKCSVCGHKVTAIHVESGKITDTAADIGTPGTWHTECVDCGKTMNTGTIPALVKIDVAKLTVAKPVKDAAAEMATTTDSAYTVANTEWTAADGTILTVGQNFNAGTVYTVKITLEAKENNVFAADSTYNKIEGKDAKLVTAVTGHTDSVILTYTFDATEGVAYNITKGANGVWVKGSTDTLSFTADGEYAKFTSVKIDGAVLAAENYTKAAGSTVITLKNDYLSSLAVGAHTIAIIYTDGDCSTQFTVHQHTYGTAWSSDDTHHWHECTDASCPNKAASVTDKAAHNFVWKIDVPASQASTGTKYEECTVCGKKRNENTVIDKLPGSSSSSGSHHSSNNSNNNNTSTEAAAPEAAAPAPAASAPVTTTTSARTGDSSNLIGWLAVLLISGGAAGAWYTVAKKKKEQ